MEQEIDWLASLRLRAGFAWDRALIYATGGLVLGGVELSADLGEIGSESKSNTDWGWTIGGGLEYAFTDVLSKLRPTRPAWKVLSTSKSALPILSFSTLTSVFPRSV